VNWDEVGDDAASRRPSELESNAGSVATKLFLQPHLDRCRPGSIQPQGGRLVDECVDAIRGKRRVITGGQLWLNCLVTAASFVTVGFRRIIDADRAK
jgi:hypothetical protein